MSYIYVENFQHNWYFIRKFMMNEWTRQYYQMTLNYVNSNNSQSPF